MRLLALLQIAFLAICLPGCTGQETDVVSSSQRSAVSQPEQPSVATAIPDEEPLTNGTATETVAPAETVATQAIDETDSPATDTVEPEPEPEPQGPRYTFNDIHDRDGIGKFYMGREIAGVMGYKAINWLERPKRENEERTSQLIESLKLKPGMVVADIGAGSGVISLLMAEQVGDDGTVVAVDIQQEMLDALAAKLKQRKIENVQLVLSTEKSPRLPKNTFDLAIMVDVYHEFSWPYEMIAQLSAAMKPGGRVVFVEYRKEDRELRIKEVHKMYQAQVKKEIGQPAFGLKWKETIDILPRQHILIFERVAK